MRRLVSSKAASEQSRAAMDLDQRDDVRGVEVVDTDEVVRAGQPLGERVHGEAAGVAADDQVRVGGLQAREEVLLGVQQLLDGLDHVGAALDGLGHVGGDHALDAVHHLLGGLGDEVELDELLDVLPDLAERPGDRFVASGHEPHVEPVLREGLRDALAHRARAHDQDLLVASSFPLGERMTVVVYEFVYEVLSTYRRVEGKSTVRRPAPARSAGRRTAPPRRGFRCRPCRRSSSTVTLCGEIGCGRPGADHAPSGQAGVTSESHARRLPDCPAASSIATRAADRCATGSRRSVTIVAMSAKPQPMKNGTW